MSPSFDAKKYNALIDGLEVVEFQLSEVLNDNLTQRIDSEYFQKSYLNISAVIGSQRFDILSNIGIIKGGKRLPLGEQFVDEGIPFIRAQDVKNGFVDYFNSPKISLRLHKLLQRYQTSKNDVLITNVGNSIGDVGIIKFKLDKCNLTENAVKVVSKKIVPDFLFAFLLTKYGNLQIQRETVGTAQPKLALERINLFKIPLLSLAFQRKIEKIVLFAHSKYEDSKTIYRSCESLLLSSLGLSDFVPSQNSVAVKSLSESFGTSGRLDAEYYQQKYEELENLLHTKHTVGSLCRIYDKTFVPHKDNYKYIELADIGTSGNITGCTIAPFEELPSRARRLVKCGQVIVSSIEGSLPSCALIPNDYDGAICSTGFYVVDSSKMNPETLLILFKSNPIQALMKKRCSGTILTALH